MELFKSVTSYLGFKDCELQELSNLQNTLYLILQISGVLLWGMFVLQEETMFLWWFRMVTAIDFYAFPRPMAAWGLVCF